MNFIKTFFASCLGSLAALVVLILLIIGFFMLSGGDNLTEVDDHSVLHLKMDVKITELELENPLEGLPVVGTETSSIGLINFKSTLSHARNDEKIKGIFLNVSNFMGGYAKAKEIRESLLEFKKSGKWIVAYSENYSEKSYYIASSADKVYLHPEGDLEFNGLAVEVSFFKKLFDKLEIKPEIFRVGEFKSAVEPFILDKMSDANKLQLNEMIRSIYGTTITEVATSRHLEPSRVKEIADKMMVTNAVTAKQNNLVDSLLYQDEVISDLKSRMGVGKDQTIKMINYGKYKKSFLDASTSKNEIAVIVADGDIVSGKQSGEMIGSETFAEEIRKARTNKKIKAIVLRINSPGGSALASDVMWREVMLAVKEKPVIASMSDVAASGGYYMAMGCTKIVAEPNTITGSIGVFSMLFDLSSFMDHKLGITFEEVKTGEIGVLATVSRPLTDREKLIWQNKTNEIYKGFTSKAANGRKMDVEELRKLASGRVWTGSQAMANGLVDTLGGMNEAIEMASRLASLRNDYKLKYYPKNKPWWENWMNAREENARVKILQEGLGTHFKAYDQIRKLQRYEGSQTRMPYELDIH